MSDQGKNTLHDNAMGWGIIACVLAAAFALFWHFFEYQMKSGFRWFRWGEMKLVSLFVDDAYTLTWKGYDINFGQWLAGTPQIPPTDLDGQTLSAISLLALTPVKIPMVIALALMGVWCLMNGPGTQFRRKLDLSGIINIQSKTFPVILPFVKFNPSTMPPRPPGAPVPAELPLFAEALGPEEWLAYNEIPIPDGAIDENAAYIAFTRQLGPRWRGPLKMVPHKQILMATFCLKSVRKRKESDVLLGRLAKCWDHEKGLQLSRDKKILKDSIAILRNKKISGTVLSKCNQHAFETTVMLRALATAREEGGVLAPAQFVWLRGYDRTLWYPLNNLGRQSFHMEALGAMAHYKSERMTRRPVPKPQVQNAVRAIVEYMRSPRARPIPPLDYKGAKKRRSIKQPAAANDKNKKTAPAKKPRQPQKKAK